VGCEWLDSREAGEVDRLGITERRRRERWLVRAFAREGRSAGSAEEQKPFGRTFLFRLGSFRSLGRFRRFRSLWHFSRFRGLGRLCSFRRLRGFGRFCSFGLDGLDLDGRCGFGGFFDLCFACVAVGCRTGDGGRRDNRPLMIIVVMDVEFGERRDDGANRVRRDGSRR
jgi:hypothetical protein